MQLGTNAGKAFLYKSKLNETAAHILCRLFRNLHYLERHLCIYILHPPPEHPSVNWANSPVVSLPVIPAMLQEERALPSGADPWHRAGGSEAQSRPQSCPTRLGDVKHWAGAAMCNLGLHSAILLGIKFQIYNALGETEGQLLFIAVGLAGVSACHVAWLLTSSTEHTARK